MTTVVRFDEVTKEYKLGSGYQSLRGLIMGGVNKLLNQKGKSEHEAQSLFALNKVSYSLEKGETLGLIGPNGSGKTTCLKLISKITKASSGKVEVAGRVSALIELGAGFHPDLTGKENIYFNAAILGMNSQETQKRFDSIVDFSGLEKFLETPVKRYSSGMYARLGFAIAAFVNPDILLVDEVLAVGDKSFQTKCLKRMSDLRENGTAIVFVTHNLGYLQRLCTRAIFLYQGEIQQDSIVSKAIEAYRNHDSYVDGNINSNKKVASDIEIDKSETQNAQIKIRDVFFSDKTGKKIEQCPTGKDIQIHIQYQAHKLIKDCNIEVWLYGLDGTEYASFSTIWDGIENLGLNDAGEIILEFPELGLMPGTYFVNIAISDSSGLIKYDLNWENHRLRVLSGAVTYGQYFQAHKWLIES